jgi:uridine phosphorylase
MNGSVRLRNPNIELMDQDILYHLALGSGSHDLVEMFGDVKVQFIYKNIYLRNIF